MSDLNLDGALDLEQELYSKGYKEGEDAATNEQYLEGKIYGLQTGFQRFLIVGYFDGLLHEWRLQDTDGQLKPQLDQLENLLNKITNDNSNQSVAVYEKTMSAARNKVRVIASITKSTNKISALDSLVRDVGGALAVASDPNEMW